jgi:uncharacterized membrane protein
MPWWGPENLMSLSFRLGGRVSFHRTLIAIGVGGLSGLYASAAAATPTEAAPIVQVTQDPASASELIRASVDIDAAPAAVWRVLVNCGEAPKLMVNLKSCRVVERDTDGHWDVRENISRGAFLPGLRTVVRADYDAPRLIRFHRVDGDLKVLDGEWRLSAIDGGARTRVTYESRVGGPFAAPGMLIRAVLRHDFPITLDNLRRACEDPEGLARP